MWLHREIYKSARARAAILATIKAKGRKVKGLERQIQEACNKLRSPEASRELYMLCERIKFSYNYQKIRLKACRNQRNISIEARSARVANFLENNPNHEVATQKQVRPKLNYWER